MSATQTEKQRGLGLLMFRESALSLMVLLKGFTFVQDVYARVRLSADKMPQLKFE